MLSTISKKSKTNYYSHYFKNNWNSIKNIWKGLKSILIIKSIFADIRKSFIIDGTLFPIQWQSQIFSTNIFLQLLLKRSLTFHFHINIFQIFFKIDLIFPFL